MVQLSHDTPEVDNWFVKYLSENGINLHSLEGYSVKDEQVTALFERLVSDVAVGHWTPKMVEEWVSDNGEIEDWKSRLILAKKCGVPLYLILYEKDKEHYRILNVTISDGEMIFSDSFNFTSCKELSKWMAQLKGIKVLKPFVENQRLSHIDNCLRRHGAPWPGNLDGFTVDHEEVTCIIEYSRTRQRKVRDHDIRQYFKKDINRWMPLKYLSEQSEVPLYIILWSSNEEVLKIILVKKITKDGLEYDRTDLIDKTDLITYFKEKI